MIFGVRITEQLVRLGLPTTASVTYRTSESFERHSLDTDLQQFASRVVPWDTSAMLLRRGILAPLPRTAGDGEDRFPSGIGVQYLPELLANMRDAAVQH
jgi:hypothetical protein